MAGSGAGAVLGSLGPTPPPQGSFMGMIFTGGNAVGGTTSTLAQSFNVTGGKLYIVQASVSFYSDEHPSQSASFNDTWQITARSPGQTATTLLKQETRADVFPAGNTSVNTATAPASGGGFTTNGPGPYGLTGFRDLTLQWTPTSTGAGELAFRIFDVGDTAVDSAILIDNVAVLEDPPLYFLRAGDKRRYSMPTTCSNTSWITGRKPCRTIVTSLPAMAGSKQRSRSSLSRTRTRRPRRGAACCSWPGRSTIRIRSRTRRSPR